MKKCIFLLLSIILLSSCSDMLDQYLGAAKPVMLLKAADTALKQHDSFDLGNFLLDQTGLTTEFIIQNTGGSDLQINEISLANGDPDEFILDCGAVQTMLGPGESTSFFISFHAQETLIRNAELSIKTNISGSPDFRITLYGECLRQPNDFVIPAAIQTPGATVFSLINTQEYGDPAVLLNEEISKRLSLFPQAFLPSAQTNRRVEFRLLWEGGAYESIFGWYNISDVRLDQATGFYVLDPENRHVIFGSGSDPAFPNAEPGEVVEIDFNAETDWDKGAIGFFLITPQSIHPDPASINESMYIYPLEHKFMYQGINGLPDTGTWIHGIMYRSLTHVNTYYFGFEDLYNPSDNDFEDTFVRADGLLPYNE
jgi:hypothetical protein